MIVRPFRMVAWMCCGSLVAVGQRHANLPVMPRRLIILALAAVLWATGIAAHAASAPTPTVVPAVEPGADNWSASPLSSGSAKDRPVIYLEGAPGSVLKDALVLTNNGEEDRTYRLTGTAAPGFPDSSVKEWFSFAEPRVTVPANTRAEIPFTVTVPANGTPGDHPGQVRVELADRSVDVPVRLRVAGKTLPALAVENVSVEGERVRYTVINRGNTVLSPQLALHAEGLTGTVVEQKAKPLGVALSPGERVTRTEQWPGAPAFDSVDLTLTVTAGGGAQATAQTTESTVSWFWLILVVLFFVGLGVQARRLRTRRRRRRVRAQAALAEPTALGADSRQDTERSGSADPEAGTESDGAESNGETDPDDPAAGGTGARQ